MSTAIRIGLVSLLTVATTSAPRRETGRPGYGPEGRSAWLDIDWRQHQRWVEVFGRPVNVIELGQGPPLVFVHGLAGSWQNWLEQLPVFAADHRVIAVDLPGFGHSPMPRDEISISGYARILDALSEALEIESAAWVGNSMGGFVSAELAIAFPQRVERLVLVSAAGIASENQREAKAIPLMRRIEFILSAYTAWIASKSDSVARRPRLRQATLWSVARHPRRLPAPLAAEQLRGSGKPGFLDAFHALSSYPIRDRLDKISCPTLIVWGDSDKLVPTRDADVFEELISNSRKVIYEDTGHVSMLERPARFNADLRAFLAE
jgi:pimeloyl-ACP methyl ester carboxylesterase